MASDKCVLVVDDDESIRQFIALCLSCEGYQVMNAPHGAAALDLIQEARPDLILLDMRMPVMDGWEFSRAYRQLPGPHAPIIVFTAACDAAENAGQIQADGYMAKPFDLEDLLSVVGRYARQP